MIKIGTIVRHKESKEIFIVVDNVTIIDEDNTWHYGVLYSALHDSNFHVRKETDFRKQFKKILPKTKSDESKNQEVIAKCGDTE